MKTREPRGPKLPTTLSAVAVAHLERRAVRFDLDARADPDTLRRTLAKAKLAPWPVLFDLERDFGGLRFAEGSEDWLLGTHAVITCEPRVRTTRSKPVPLVCVGVNATGRLLIDESGNIWDEDEAANSVHLRADGMERRLEREAHGFRTNVLGQRFYEVLPSTIAAAAGAKKLGLPLVKKASDAHEKVWQNASLTVLKTTDDVRVFAKTDAALQKALTALGAR